MLSLLSQKSKLFESGSCTLKSAVSSSCHNMILTRYLLLLLVLRVDTDCSFVVRVFVVLLMLLFSRVRHSIGVMVWVTFQYIRLTWIKYLVMFIISCLCGLDTFLMMDDWFSYILDKIDDCSSLNTIVAIAASDELWYLKNTIGIGKYCNIYLLNISKEESNTR